MELKSDSDLTADTSGPRSSVSVVVPVYLGRSSLPELARRLEPVLAASASDYELIFVNDGSPDDSWRVITSLAERHDWIRGIDLMRNYGQHNALLAGIRAARHDVIVTMDDDLQNPPEEVPKLLGLLSEGHDVVYGTPPRQREGLLRDTASFVTKMVMRSVMGVEIAPKISSFRALRADVRAAFARYMGPFVSIDVLLTWATSRFAAVPVRHERRISGPSTYTPGKLALHAINLVTGFSTLPLQLASFMGFSFTLVGLILLIFVVARYLIEGTTVPGFAFLASMISLFSGAQLFALGIIGEYLARIHFRMMERPPYAVRGQTPSTDRPGP